MKRSYWKTCFQMTCKKGQFDAVEQFIAFTINLNAQHVNGMTPDVRLLDTLKYANKAGAH